MAVSLLVALVVTTLGMDFEQGPSGSASTPVADTEPAGTKLFFGPTGRSLEAGEVYLSFNEIASPFVQIGVTDRFSIGAGAPLLAGDLNVPAGFTPKLQIFNRRSTHAALGVVHFLNVGDGAFGVAYGVVTKGSAGSAVTVGAGYAYETFAEGGGGAPVVLLGGEHCIRRGIRLLTENYAFRSGALLTGGVRFSGRHLSADVGLGTVLADGARLPFPVMNVVWKF